MNDYANLVTTALVAAQGEIARLRAACDQKDKAVDDLVRAYARLSDRLTAAVAESAKLAAELDALRTDCARISADEALCGTFRKSRDIHRETAVRVFDASPEDVDTTTTRSREKAINFGVLYGMEGGAALDAAEGGEKCT